MTRIDEVSPDLFRISTFVPEANIQFNQFLVRDDEPLLFHTGLKELFPMVREAVSKIIDPAAIRWIGFSHLEADECGSLRQWQEIAPHSIAVCSFVGKIVSIDDFVALRPAKGMNHNETFKTGKYAFRFLQTPHVPHCWEAGLLFEETQKTLLCSDLFHQNGDVEPYTTSDVVGRFRQMLIEYNQSPLAGYMPYTANTGRILGMLAELKPKTVATMHGSTYSGDCQQALIDLNQAMKEVLI